MIDATDCRCRPRLAHRRDPSQRQHSGVQGSRRRSPKSARRLTRPNSGAIADAPPELELWGVNSIGSSQRLDGSIAEPPGVRKRVAGKSGATGHGLPTETAPAELPPPWARRSSEHILPALPATRTQSQASRLQSVTLELRLQERPFHHATRAAPARSGKTPFRWSRTCSRTYSRTPGM